MKKITDAKVYLIILTIFNFQFSIFHCSGQQIKRSALSSTAKISTQTQYRVTSTTGSCPGCSVLHPLSPAKAPFSRQGFQQPPVLYNTPGCFDMSTLFNTTTTQTACGLRFDFEYAGNTITDVTFDWDFGQDAFPKKSDVANPVSIFYATAGLKIITLTVRKGGVCTQSASKVFTLSPTQFSIGARAVLTNVKCFGDKTGSITTTPVGGKSPYSFGWSTGSTGNILSGIGAGTYQVTITDALGCKFSIDTVVTQPSQPLSIAVTKIDETCAGFKDGSVSVNVSGGTKPFTYKWSNGVKDYTADTLIAGKYTLALKDTFGCKLDTVFTIIDRCKKTLASYDIITPNGDGINDTWVFPHIEDYPNNQLFIYNRWGQSVYSKSAYLNDWAGQTNYNQPLLTGAYFYVLKLNDTKQQVFSGSITLLR